MSTLARDYVPAKQPAALRVVRTGLDRIAAGDDEVLRFLRGRRVGLCAHPASVDARLRHARFVLEGAGVPVRALFGPEHGYGGEAQDMIAVAEHAQDVPVYSLYGASEADLSPSAAQLRDLDVIVVDLQDVGSRYYTFVWSAVLVLRAAAKLGVETIVLDRPNPLGGVIVEGGPQRPGYRSFVGLRDVAVRHGMTIAELCGMAQREEGLDAGALRVVPMQGYRRELSFEETGLPWVLPSPNMPTLDTAPVYPGGCLLEGTNLSEGRGTTRPFELWGAPALDAARLVENVAADGCGELPGVALRPLTFSPTFHKHAGQRCFGVQVHVTVPSALRSYALYLRLIAAARRAHPAEVVWRTTEYEFVTDRPAIDLLTGGPEFRTTVDAAAAGDLPGLLAEDRRSAAAFEASRRPYLLY
jgi:uncharacterized protein YbbC (DUF1343 family)